MRVWWERMLAVDAGLAGVFEPSPAPNWWELAPAEWADYQRGFRISGGERDPLNALHRLAFEQMFAPAWQATPHPITCRLTSRSMLRYAQSIWRRTEPFTPSRALLILQQHAQAPGGCRLAILLADPAGSRRVELIFPERLEPDGRSIHVRDFTGNGTLHRLRLDPSTESWDYRDGNGTNWQGSQGRGRIVLLPKHLLSRDPLPLVEPGTEAETDLPISLAILSGSARLPMAPDEAPWWVFSTHRQLVPQGYLFEMVPGRSLIQIAEVSGAYEYSVLQAGRVMIWRGEGAGWDMLRVSRQAQTVQFVVRTDGAKRWGSFELVQAAPDRQSVRAFRLERLELPAGSDLEICAGDDASQLALTNRSRHPISASLEVEVGWAAQVQRRRLPRLTLAAGEQVTFRPVRWRALGLGPISVIREMRGRSQPA